MLSFEYQLSLVLQPKFPSQTTHLWSGISPEQHRHTLTKARFCMLFPSSSSSLSSSSWLVIFLYIFIHSLDTDSNLGVIPSAHVTAPHHQASYVLMPSLKYPSLLSLPSSFYILLFSFPSQPLPTAPTQFRHVSLIWIFHNPND